MGRGALRFRARRLLAVGAPLLVLAVSGFGGSSGRVVVSVATSASEPVSGAIVTVLGTGLSGRTDASGNAHLSGVPSGSQSLRVSAPGFYPAVSRVLVPAHGSYILSVLLSYELPFGTFVFHTKTAWYALTITKSAVKSVVYAWSCLLSSSRWLGAWERSTSSPPTASGPSRLPPGWSPGRVPTSVSSSQGARRFGTFAACEASPA